MKKLYALLGILAVVSACATSREEGRVVERSDNLKERPFWAKAEDSVYPCIIGKDGFVKKGVASDGERYFCSLGIYDRFTGTKKKKMDSKMLMQTAVAISKKGFNSMIKTKLQGNANGDFNGILLKNVKTVERYWEKKIIDTEDGQRYRYVFYALTAISEKDLQDSIDATAKKESLIPETQELPKKDTLSDE